MELITKKKLLVVGGSGIVGSLTLPYLAKEHALRVFDAAQHRQVAGDEEVQIGALTQNIQRQ